MHFRITEEECMVITVDIHSLEVVAVQVQNMTVMMIWVVMQAEVVSECNVLTNDQITCPVCLSSIHFYTSIQNILNSHHIYGFTLRF